MNGRTKNALVTLAVGLALNIALGISKLVVGFSANSVSVSSDAANNLSDAAVSVVSLIAVALSARAADRDHPYGHGRYEYIATFILGAVIVAVGIEVLRGGVERAMSGEPVEFGTAVWATLGASVGVKAFMAVFYAVRGKRQSSDTVKAAAIDSASDAVVTSLVLICAVIEKFTGVSIDGYASIAIGVVILVFAIKILKRVISRLLGERPDGELVHKVNDTLSGSTLALSSHDLIINDYGELNKIAEVDLVFPAELGFIEVHDECDMLERKVYDETGVKLSIHADPLVTSDERAAELDRRISAAICGFGATAHEIGIDDCKSTVRLGIKLPEGDVPVNEIKTLIEAEVRAVVPYRAEIHVDYL